MKNKTYLILAFLALFSITSHSYFHISEFEDEHEHEHEEEFCDHCSVAEISFFINENLINENLYLENYFFSYQSNLTNLFNHYLSIRAPPIS